MREQIDTTELIAEYLRKHSVIEANSQQQLTLYENIKEYFLNSFQKGREKHYRIPGFSPTKPTRFQTVSTK